MSRLPGVFFSKTRREEVTEMIEEPEYALVSPGPNAGTTFSGPASSAGSKIKVTLLSQGDFMRGCPETSEQVHLFSLYNKLSEQSRKCPNWQTCGGDIKLQKSDFVAIYVSALGEPGNSSLNVSGRL